MRTILSAIFLTTLLVSGCCPTCEVVKPPQKIDCPAPTRPVLKQTTTYEPKIFFSNFSDVVEYSLMLEKSNQCFRDALK